MVIPILLSIRRGCLATSREKNKRKIICLIAVVSILVISSVFIMIKVFLIAISQLANKSLRRVIWFGLVGSAAIFMLLIFAISLILFGTNIFVFQGFLGLFNPILEFFTDLFGIALVLFLSCLLFPSVVYLIVSFFSEDVALAVEAELYPYLPEPRKQSKREIITVTIKFVIVSLVLNIFIIPVYAVLLPVSPFVFYALNGYIMGREYFELVALRRVNSAEAQTLRRAFRGQLFLAGTVIALMMTIPIVNFLTPVIAVAAMVNLVEAWRNTLRTS